MLVVLFHDETTFQVNEDQPTLWAEKGTSVMRPKPKGSGIMVSDFIREKHGYLELTDKKHDKVKKSDPTIRKHARQTLEYGKGKGGYRTSHRFMLQIKESVKIADVKFPREAGWRVVWIFDHSSCHAVMPDDALDASKMNVNLGGKQQVLRDGFWNGKAQRVNYALGIPRVVFEERGIDTKNRNAEKQREVLSSHF